MTKKQNQTKRKNKKPLPLFTYFCLLLTVAIMSVGTTFARYATSSSVAGSGGIAAMLASFTIDEVSSTSFSNSDYWVNIEGQDVAQNSPREILFTVRNYKEDQNKVRSKASGVDIQSTFRIHGTEEFLGNIAFQILKKGEGNTRIPLTQQYILPEIINKVTEGVTEISTADFVEQVKANVTDENGNVTETLVDKPLDYGEYQGRPEETLELTNLDFELDTTTNVATGRFVAVAKAKVPVEQPDGSTKDEEQTIATIALTSEKRTAVNYVVTQTCGKIYKVEGSTNEVNDMSAPEYYSTYQTPNDENYAVPYYALDVTVPGMKLEAKKDKAGNFIYADNQYIFAFTIINQETFKIGDGDTKIGEHFDVNGIDFFKNSDLTGSPLVYNVKVVNTLEKDSNEPSGYRITSSKYYAYINGVENEFTLSDVNKVTLGANTYYLHKHTAESLNKALYDPRTGTEDYTLGDIVKKVYPLDIRVLFTQASET